MRLMGIPLFYMGLATFVYNPHWIAVNSVCTSPRILVGDPTLAPADVRVQQRTNLSWISSLRSIAHYGINPEGFWYRTNPACKPERARLVPRFGDETIARDAG